MIAALGPTGGGICAPSSRHELSELEASLVDRQTLDPEEPAEMFSITRPGAVCSDPGAC